MTDSSGGTPRDVTGLFGVFITELFGIPTGWTRGAQDLCKQHRHLDYRGA